MKTSPLVLTAVLALTGTAFAEGSTAPAPTAPAPTAAATPAAAAPAAPAPVAIVPAPAQARVAAPAHRPSGYHSARYGGGEGASWKTGRDAYGFMGSYGGRRYRGHAGPYGFRLDRAC